MLPDALAVFLADAEFAVTSWSLEADELTIKVEKDIGPEIGRLSFRGVTHVCLPPALTVDGMEVHTLDTVPADFWHVSAPPKSELGDSERIFFVFGSYGGRFYVIAESIDYEVLQ